MAVKAKSPIAWLVIDDVIDMFQNLKTNENVYSSIFEEPTLKFYKKMHDSYGTVTLLSVFYSKGYDLETSTETGFNLSQCPDKFKAQFQANASWLKFSFHGWSGLVRYNAFKTGKDANYDYSRDMLADYDVIKTEILRIAGIECWSDNAVNHFYDYRKADVDAQKNICEIKIGVCTQNKDRGVCGYLDLAQQEILKSDGYYFDETNGTIHTLRDFAFERIRGTLEVPNTPKRTIDFLDYYNHRSKTFMNPETHEVQIMNGPSKQWPSKKDINDFCAWCYNRGYKWKFPTKSDFDII
jgi:hypothetical protein